MTQLMERPVAVLERAAEPVLEVPKHKRNWFSCGHLRGISLGLDGELDPILGVHGMWGKCSQFEPQMRIWADAGHPTYALNLRGHWSSGIPQTKHNPWQNPGLVTFEEYVSDVSAVLDFIDRPTILDGHSLGGLIVQKVAETHPLVKAVVLVASAPPSAICLQGKVQQVMMKPCYQYAMWGSKPFKIRYEDALSLMLNNTPNADTAYEELTLESGMVARQLAWYRIPVSQERMLKHPCLVISGQYDKLILPDIGRRLAERYKAEHVIFDNAHMIVNEPGCEKIAQTVVDFARCL